MRFAAVVSQLNVFVQWSKWFGIGIYWTWWNSV